MKNKKDLNENMRFVIFSPMQVTGGGVALHKLCKTLSELGYDAKIFYCWPFVKWCENHDASLKNKLLFLITWLKYTLCSILKEIISAVIPEKYMGDYLKGKLKGYLYRQVKGTKRHWLPWVRNNTIVIYPDIVYGNPLGATNVIRWFLYFNRYNDENAYGKKDLFICYREVFNDSKLNPRCLTVYISDYDKELYRRVNCEKRKGNCYIIRKGRNREDLPQKLDGPIIDNLSEIEIAECFNKYEYCISYDSQTFYSTLAAICGCISVVALEVGKERKDYLGDDDTRYGIAYGFSDEEITRAINEIELLKSELCSIEENNKNNTRKLIDYCKEYFI